MDSNTTLIVGGNHSHRCELNLAMANRHGLIAGATGTGKTVTLQVLAEGFARSGVPVFLADVKGDLSGLAAAGKPHAKIDERLGVIGLPQYSQRAYPCVFWDLWGAQGHPVRTTISEFGPLLLSAFLDLNDVQTGLLYSAFKLADDRGLLLLDLKDLRELLNWMKQERASLEGDYGAISSASIGAIQRNLLMLEEQGAEQFFGEPALQLNDLMQTDFGGTGVVSILDATRLIHQPRLYSIFLLWLISELFEELPEVGDKDRPKLVFFFDEAHLLFNNAPKALLEKIEQVVRLIRSKGVGIYFVSQSPADIPENVLGQLGNRVQHALRAFTPKDQKAVKVAAQTFRPNPSFSTETAITELGVGEALVSVLDNKGSPTEVERVLVCPPESRIGPLSVDERVTCMSRSPLKGRYDQLLDRESAYEVLRREAEIKVANSPKVTETRSSTRSRQTVLEAMTKSAARSIGSSLGRQLIRGVLGTLLKKR
jgi:DNA helicase HerA-like ATPase